MRLIDADALIEWFSPYAHTDECIDFVTLKRDIEDTPTVDAELVHYGRWVTVHKGNNNYVECSECRTVGSPFWKRCPLCEAKMKGAGNHAAD